MARLAKELTLYGLIMVAIGSCIGSGIFVTPSTIAGLLPSHSLILMIWVLGGIISLSGALTFGELGSMFPQAGGIYVYLREAYGNGVAFLYGWAYLIIITSGSIAVLALAFSYYLSFLIPMNELMKIIVSIITIIILTTINIFRAKFGEIFSNIFTGLKIIGILLIIATGFIFGKNQILAGGMPGGPSTGQFFANFGVALTGVLFSYSGWQHASFLAGETKNPSRNVPVAMITGAIVVTVIYLFANAAYMKLLPLDRIIGSEKLAAEAVSTVIPSGGTVVAAIIAICTVGTIGIYTLSAPRIYYAMAADGIFFKSIARVHEKFQTPVNAILLQSLWAVLLLLFWGTVENLITYTVAVEWIFYGLAAAGIFIFRKKLKNTHRPYRANGYPVTPMIFVGITTWFIINITINKPLHMGIGIAFLLLGLPAYYYFKRKNRQRNDRLSSANLDEVEGDIQN
jgi:APA family basic amino acid/polyamine antiporter